MSSTPLRSKFGLAITIILAAAIVFLFWDGRLETSCRSTIDGDIKHAYRNNTKLKLEYDPYDDVVSLDGVVPRAFPVFSEPFPCVEPDEDWDKTKVLRSPASEGFFFVKEMKTGSSTVAGVAIRISLNMARRQGKEYDICKARFDHTRAWQMKFAKRDRKKSILWTIIREPNSRAASQFFHFEVSRKKVDPTDANFENYLFNTIDFDNHYFQTLSVTDYMGVEDEVNFTNKVLQDYDFIGVTERMNESLVALSMLLNLELTDILYLKSKENGSFDFGGTDKCTYIVPTYISPRMKEYFSHNKQWVKRSLGDHILYRAAHRSLDMTIDHLGRSNFTAKLAEFNRLQEKVEEECLNHVMFPCDAGGRRNTESSCLWADSGCGNSCIDGILNKIM